MNNIRQKMYAMLIIGVSFMPFYMHAQERLYSNEFPLADVTLLDGPLKHARDLNIVVLLKYNPDRLLAPYRKEAGLKPKALSYPNWSGLDGHIAGHYLSAMAINYAATGNVECGRRMEYILSQLDECQKANAVNNPEWGKNYVGGFPESAKLWSTFKKGNFEAYFAAWAPFYNLHKMYAGLRDAWLYCSNNEARDMFLRFCDWGIDITSELTDVQMEHILSMEHGGMDEIYADAFAMTGDSKYLKAAKRFAHKILLEPMSKGIDNLDNMHANTQIPKVVGFQRIAEVSHDRKYSDASSFFWETVTRKRSLVFGGNSRREHFPSKDACIDYVNDVDGPESCNSYNMLKLTEDLFRTNPQAKYSDFYERTVFNHILSTQHPVHGGYVYFTSARPRHYRVYSAPNEAMWCCVGTGMENHGKYNQFIYTHTGDSLFVNLFVASELRWRECGIRLRQETLFPYSEHTRLTIAEGKSKFKLLLRYPNWVKAGEMKVTVNGKNVLFSVKPSSYVTIEREWKKGDIVELYMPMYNSIEHLPNVPQYIAFMRGPILLAMKTGTEDLKGLIADDSRWGQYAGGSLLPIDKAPILIDNDIEHIACHVKPIANEPLHFNLDIKMINAKHAELRPFYQIHDSRYMMYWLALTDASYKSYVDSLANIEKQRIILEKRSLDHVATGEQQPETDHAMYEKSSITGNTQNIFYRDANNGGFFSYDMTTNSETDLKLYLRYWGVAEWGIRIFDIYIDDVKMTTVDNTHRWNQSQFKTEEYNIPDVLVKGKKHIRVKFQAHQDASIGGIYDVRILKTQP